MSVYAADAARRQLPPAGKLWPVPKQALLGAVTILTEAFTNTNGERYAWVSTKMPARERPARFIRVSRIGGGQDDPITDVARLLVECFGRSSRDTELMCNTARAALHNAVGSWVVPDQPHDPPWTPPAQPDPLPSVDSWPAGVDEQMFVRWCGNESGPADLPHPDVLDYERWQFTIDLWIAANTAPRTTTQTTP